MDSQPKTLMKQRHYLPSSHVQGEGLYGLVGGPEQDRGHRRHLGAATGGRRTRPSKRLQHQAAVSGTATILGRPAALPNRSWDDIS